MKKILSAVAALGLVAGVASSAAALDFSVSGTYSITGNYLSDSNGSGLIVNETPGVDNAPDSYWMHTFQINPVMKVNDQITMFSQIRLADNSVWGNQTNGDVATSPMGAVDSSTGDVYVHQLYMQYMSPIGKFQMGRVSSGAWGTPFLDNDSRADGIKWWPSMLASGPWSTYFAITKNTEMDAQTANTVANQDSDSYEGRVYYKDDALDAGIRYAYTNNQTAAATDATRSTYGLYGVYKFSNYFVATEIVHLDGSTDTDGVAAVAGGDPSAEAGLLEVGGQFDNLSVAAAYVYLSGDDNSSDRDNDAFAALNNGTGTEFTPLYILTGRGMGCLNADINGADNISGGAVATAGTHTFALLADYKASDRLSLHGAIAYAMADEETQSNGAGGYTFGYAGRDDSYGWEYDLGAAYKLLDNLTYEAHFGYLDTGDFFNSSATANDATNVYILTHSLTMTF